jgi:hypothetical protein
VGDWAPSAFYLASPLRTSHSIETPFQTTQNMPGRSSRLALGLNPLHANTPKPNPAGPKSGPPCCLQRTAGVLGSSRPGRASHVWANSYPGPRSPPSRSLVPNSSGVVAPDSPLLGFPPAAASPTAAAAAPAAAMPTVSVGRDRLFAALGRTYSKLHFSHSALPPDSPRRGNSRDQCRGFPVLQRRRISRRSASSSASSSTTWSASPSAAVSLSRPPCW